MDYQGKLFYGLFLASYLLWSVDASCGIEDRTSGCNYTVLCDTFAGSVNNPGCNGNPNVTFIVIHSEAVTLSTGFFSSTNFDSRVRYFIGIRNTWNYIRFSSLKFFRYSVYVDLSNNNVETIDDKAFNDLTLMKYLNLSHNAIEVLSDRSLVVSDSSDNALEILDLSNNLLMSLNNNVLTQCQNLQELYLQNNKLKILSDTCFDHLKNLKRLIIYNNQIYSLNMTVTALTQMTFLDISHNRLHNLFGYELMRLISLENLNMSFNNIESISHNSFSLIPKLEVLDLSFNKISSDLYEDMFTSNHYLKYLDLHQNNITILTPFVFKFSNLDFVNLESNNITGNITRNILKGLRNLSNLSVTFQNLKAIENNALSDMVNLQYLNLSHNFIKTIENSSFVNASSLIILDLSYNIITDLHFFTMFSSNLTEIYLNNNNILSISGTTFENHNNLKKLYMSKNRIANIEPNSLPLNSLQVLDINTNNVTGILREKVFSPARLLRFLDLSNFHLKMINASALIDLPLVTRVNLSHNDIEFVHPNNFKGLKNMFSLDVSFNNLTDLLLNTNLDNLLGFHISNNKLMKMPNLFGNASKLQYLDISYNNISNITDIAFKNISRLKVLHLSNNHIVQFNNEFINSLVDLTDLDVSSNQIQEMINLSFFEQLQSVNLSDNKIAHVNISHFKNKRLIYLSLSGNKIKELEPGTFQFLNSLIELDLSSNYLTQIRFGTLRGLNETKTINLARNKINVLNEEVFHECYELKTLIVDYNNITKIDVARISVAVPKLKVLSLGGNPIACEEILRSKRVSGVLLAQMTVTSLHEVYHEDNVHGIKCGVNNANDTVESTTVKTTNSQLSTNEVPSSTVLYIWCGILSVILVLGLATLYIYKNRRNGLTVNRESRMQFMSSGTMSNSECYNSDLLS